MAEMLHEIVIDAAPETVMDALTTQEGLKSWWTANCEASPDVGSKAILRFGGGATVFRMTVEEIVPAKQVVWSCQGEPEEWQGTRLHWNLTVNEGKTRLRFCHEGWKSTDGIYAICNTTWGHLMVLLKQHCEGKKPGPYFR
ncbi:MAG: SRPBCC domain-containing protein [Planctomycetota bacterium]|nr:MAG: SRPBCC domain-containing protein [Planctomycetota bacterium]REJ91997.1 MAG: SRPBCC domain-containing protein [Planctomycetota bacterium]REK28533.1 MAG: SRPBCC domain-containing protein [Planctomycetota bacterium]REK39148.1 MAG: SRPBCC domain-containing protein [Planctomycetota bacterium]